MSTYEKVMGRKETPRRSFSANDRPRTSGIFLNFKDGDNPVRLVGDYLEIRTHRIAPTNRPGWKERGICKASSFDGQNKLPEVVLCSDWDMDKEAETPKKTCPICAIERAVDDILRKEGRTLDSESKKSLYKILSECRAKVQFKWNVLDRLDPFIIQTTNGVDSKIKGYKVASLGIEAYRYVKLVFDQVKVDISGVDSGIDINIVKSRAANAPDGKSKVSYSASVIIVGKGVKETPLTEEEKALPMHDLKKLSGKVIPPDFLVASMHEDLKELYESIGTVESKKSTEPTETTKNSGFECFSTYDTTDKQCAECPDANDCKVASENK